jgi:enoyl-CoA hydratase
MLVAYRPVGERQLHECDGFSFAYDYCIGSAISRSAMEYVDYTGLKFSRPREGVLLVTINRPERFNAADERLHAELGRVWLDVDRDPETRVVIITGAGKAFSAGGDIEMEMRTMGNYERIVATLEDARNLVLNIANCGKPIISAINGVAVGAGLATALMADISIIADNVRFTDGHMRIGVTAGDHATIIWPLLCGMAKAKYYLLTADFIDAPEAERIGLVSRCVPAEDLMDEALAVAEKLTNKPADALRWTKRSLNAWVRQMQPTFEASLALEMINFFGDDMREGFKAVAEKRPPVFPSLQSAAEQVADSG